MLHHTHPNPLTPASLALKSGEAGVFAGYASVFGLTDSQRDVILRGAFTRTLSQRRTPVRLLWQHQLAEPIGEIEILREDAHGLYVRARLMLELTRAREAYRLLRSKVVTGLSIGYTPLRFRFDRNRRVRVIQEVALWEVSIVTFPANEAAQITVVKAAPPEALAAALTRMHRALAALSPPD